MSADRLKYVWFEILYFCSNFLGLGHQGAHPTPLEAMQRLRIFLLGKGGDILVKNPSVELEIDEERDISPAEIVEHLERARFLEQETVVSKDVTSHLTLSAEDQNALLESQNYLATVALTQKEIDEKLNSNSFQVIP